MPAPQQSGQPDNSAGILWGVAALFVAIGVIWYIFKNEIVNLYLLIKLSELNFFSLFSAHFNSDNFAVLREAIVAARANPSAVSFHDIVVMGDQVGAVWRIPLALFLLALAVIVYKSNATRVYRRLYSMEELAKLEKNNWPQISPVIGLNLIKTDIDTGPWAMAMSPMQFCKRYKLLEEFRPQRMEGMSRKDWDRIEVNLKRGEANKIFALQLGALWKGTDKLPPHTRALFAAFAARINADSKAAATLLKQLNLSSDAKEFNMAGVDELLKKYENTKEVQRITQSHAYVLTVMASMLEAARQDGVQASADFLWLKPRDRVLWYILNTVGRQTPFIEVGGVFAHWISEKEAGRKLLVPMVEEATNAVELALKEVLYRPDE